MFSKEWGSIWNFKNEKGKRALLLGEIEWVDKRFEVEVFDKRLESRHISITCWIAKWLYQTES